MANPPHYELRCELRGHEEDVRGVLSCPLGIVTASRDKTVKIWVEEGAAAYKCASTLVGHTDFVGPLAYIAPGTSADYPQGALVSGSRDTTLIVWDAATAAPLARLSGHAYQVSAVGVLPTGEIVSASLDKTLRLWRGGGCVATLEGHEAAVLSLLVLPSGDILSGSGDMTIKQWSGKACVNTFRGHTDTVRGLALLPGVGFVSASHDLTLRVWTLGGQTVAELLGHSALVYAVDCTASGRIVSGSEDNTCRIWNAGGECLQVINHVSCVWDVAFCPQGDVVSACGDFVARVWTTDAQHMAPADAREAYAATLESVVQQRAAAAAEAGAAQNGGAGGAGGLPPGVKVEQPQSLNTPGTKDGQNKFVQEGQAVVAYAWDMKEWKWEKIGEVVSAPTGGTAGTIKKYYQGREYDFVIDVDIADGAPPLKLALNREDNPYLVADAFIEQHELPGTYKSQIVQFIMQQTAEAGPAYSHMPVTGGGCDPFTGGSTSSAPPAAPARTMHHAPQTVFLVFDNLPPVDKLAAKVREFSAALQADPSTSSLALTVDEGGQLESQLQALAALTTAAGGGAGSAAHVAALHQLAQLMAAKLLRWPAAQVFPVLDAARLLVLCPAAIALVPALLGSAAEPGAGTLWGALCTAASASAPPAALQLAIRAACNTFKQPELRGWLASQAEGLQELFAGADTASNKAVRLSYATLLCNLVVLEQQQQQQAGAAAGALTESKLRLLSGLLALAAACPTDDLDTTFRCLVALATLVRGGGELGQVAKDLDVQEVLRRVQAAPEASAPAGRRVLEAALDVAAALEGRQ